MPYGILFLFVPKEHVQEVWRLMSSWGLVYIENLTWVHLQADNAVRKDPSPYFCSSHTTLYMFRWSGERWWLVGGWVWFCRSRWRSIARYA